MAFSFPRNRSSFINSFFHPVYGSACGLELLRGDVANEEAVEDVEDQKL